MTNTQVTTKIDPLGLQQTADLILQVADLPTRVAALDARFDAILAAPEHEVDRHELRRELDMIAIAEGGEAGRLAMRLQEVGEARLAAIDEEAPRLREEAKISHEKEISGIHFVMDTEGRFAFTDYQDETEQIWEFNKRQTGALAKYWIDRALFMITEMCKEREERKDEPAPAPTPPVYKAPVYPRAMPLGELYMAPNCDGSILTHPPRVRQDIEGFQRLELLGDDGWQDYGVVEEVTRLERHGLVLVATDSSAYLMGAKDFDHPIE